MFKLQDIKSLEAFNLERFGYFCFLAGIFFLASAVGISVLLLIISLFISFLKPAQFFKDKWNYPLFISAFLMLISVFIHFQTNINYFNADLDPKLSLLGLINWFPFFLSFWGFQKYLDSPKKRITASKLIIYGSVPVIFSGILQLLNINGPFQLFYGLIVWFQKPLAEVGSISGLFNNQNYAGLWMVMVWPFCISELKKPKRPFSKKIILFIVCFLFASFIFLTDSRNAILGLIISSPIVLGSSSLIWYLPTIMFGFFLLALTIFPIFPIEIQVFMKSIIPSRIYTLFPEIGFNNISSYPRVNKWIAGLVFLTNKPLFGWGAASFPVLYYIRSGEWFGHSHNLPLELAVSYGILPSLIVFSLYAVLLYLSFKKISKLPSQRNFKLEVFLNNKAWFAASLIFFTSHFVDIQYFDVRISAFCWILLAGLRSLLKEGLENPVS